MELGTHTTAAPRRRRLLVAIPLLLVVLSACNTDVPQGTLDPAGPIGRDIDGLFWLVFWIAVVVFVVVQGALLFSVLRFRMRKGEEVKPVVQVHGNTRLEVLWTIIPAVLLAGIAVPTLSTLFDLSAEPEGERIDVNVTGHQWWWEFEYPELGVITANELHIPAEENVYLTMTSADVIHSFWVPRLNGKRDAVPGRVTNLTLIADADEVGPEPILGLCAEFCGLAHADMRLRVFVHTPEDFAEWAAQQAQPATIPADGPAAAGWETFQLVCTACHAVGGTEYDLRLAPDLTHFGSRTTFGGSTFESTPENLRAWLHNPSDLKPMDPDRNDIAAGRILGMPNFGLSESEITELIALLEGFE